MKNNRNIRQISRNIIGILLLGILCAGLLASCAKDEEQPAVQTEEETVISVSAPEGALAISDEDGLRTFLGASGQGDWGFITAPMKITSAIEVNRPGVLLEAAPGAMLTIGIPEDESFGWPVINTLDVFKVNAPDVSMKGISISVPDEGWNAYNVIKLDDASRFSFDNGSIMGHGVRTDGAVTDYSVACGISIDNGSKDVRISNSVITDALRPVSISAGGTALTNLIFNSDIHVSYGYGSEEDLEMSGCTAIPGGSFADGGSVTFARTTYDETPSLSLIDSLKKANSSIEFIVE